MAAAARVVRAQNQILTSRPIARPSCLGVRTYNVISRSFRRSVYFQKMPLSHEPPSRPRAAGWSRAHVRARGRLPRALSRSLCLAHRSSGIGVLQCWNQRVPSYAPNANAPARFCSARATKTQTSRIPRATNATRPIHQLRRTRPSHTQHAALEHYIFALSAGFVPTATKHCSATVPRHRA